MSRKIALLLITLLLTAAGCRNQIELMESFLAQDSNSEVALYTTVNESIVTGTTSTTPFNYASVTATLTNTINQLIILNFSNGVVDAASITAGGITLHALNDTSGTYETAAALSFTTMVVPVGAANSAVYLTADLTSATSTIIVTLNSATLTANGGTDKLNEDGDQIAGEAQEDDSLIYLAVTGGTAVAANQKANRATTTVTWTASSVRDAGINLIGSTMTDAIGGYQTDSAIINAAVQLFKWTNNTWAASGKTINYNVTTGAVDLVYTTPTVAGECYKVVVDLYEMKENSPVRGYVHRALYNQTNLVARYSEYIYAITPGAVATPTFTLATGGNTYSRYIDVTFSADVDTASLSVQTLRFHDTTDNVWLNYSSYIYLSGTTYRFFLPTYYEGVAGNNISVVSNPGLKNLAGNNIYANTATADGSYTVATTF